MKTRSVLAFVEGTDHVCCRYRLKAFLPRLAALGTEVTIRAFRKDPIGRLTQFRDAADFDAVLIQRKLLPSWQLKALRARSRYLVFDFDDAVMCRDSYHPKGTHDERRVQRFRRLAERCDCLIAGNMFLAHRVSEWHVFGPRVEVIPTCVDPAKYAAKTTVTNNGPCRLVWVGSSSTLPSLERERAQWDLIGQVVPGMVLRVVCDRFPTLGAMPVEQVPWAEATEANAIVEADVGVSFLPNDEWSRGKCGLKVLQYMAGGLPVVADTVGVQPEMVRPDVNGYLVDSIEERIEALKALRDDPALRLRMGQAGRDRVVRDYSLERWAEPLALALQPT